jgi:peptide/nickel transport system substrate-binding protein
MFRSGRRPRAARAVASGAARRAARRAAAGALLAALLAACTHSSSTPVVATSPSPAATSTAVVSPGGTARVALPANVTPNWIWPYTPSASGGETNVENFQMLLYRPLYMFGDNGTSVDVNYPLSPASAPAYADGGKTVTIRLKGWKWSNGETVDANDVIFWLNMMRAEPAQYYGYTPGLLPDNLASYSATGPDTVVLKLKSAVSTIWFTYNQLAEITPMPMAWDVTGLGGKAGSGGCTTDSAADNWAKCAQVFKFLTAQSKALASYKHSSLWSVVDGPWRLTGFITASSGPVVSFAANKKYSGTPRPYLSGLKYYAFQQPGDEYAALKAGKLDAGYIPAQYLPQKPPGQQLPATNPLGLNFNLQASYAWGIQYLVLNYQNPTVGAAFKQLYVRQALQMLVDQQGMISSVARGYGYPTSGGVPDKPQSPWVPSVQNQNGGDGPYPFSVNTAKTLLTGHGWSEVGGVMTCERPSKCGPGVAKGTRLEMTMDYAAGSPEFQAEVAMYKSDAAQAGVQVNLVTQAYDTIIGEAARCAGSKCTWDMLNFGGWTYSGPGYEPTGEMLFETGATANAGSYSDATENRLIGATHTSNSPAVFQQYATYTAEQLPLIWMPNVEGISAVTAKLADVSVNPLAALLPEYWYFTK